jgi:hypothetical protein
MTINISDVTITLGQQSNSINWWEFLKVLVPVFVGGFITYNATRKVKTEELKRENIQKFTLVGQITYFCFEDINTYKEQILKPIRQKIDNKQAQLSENLSCLYIPKNDFNISIKEYVFLGGFNNYFPDLLNKTNTIYQLFKQSIDVYNEFVKNDITAKIVYKEEYVFNKDAYITSFENLEKITNELLIRLYLILKNCNTCYDKYYNLGCFDNIKESFNALNLGETVGLKDILEDTKYQHMDAYQKTFDKSWIGQPRLRCTICYWIRKFKHVLKWLKVYFILPDGCKLLKKNKEKEQANESGNS